MGGTGGKCTKASREEEFVRATIWYGNGLRNMIV